MAKVLNSSTITITKKALEKGVVILDLEKYKKFWREELEKEYIDKIAQEGLKEDREGKTEFLEDFLKREYPTLYEKYNKS